MTLTKEEKEYMVEVLQSLEDTQLAFKVLNGNANLNLINKLKENK